MNSFDNITLYQHCNSINEAQFYRYQKSNNGKYNSSNKIEANEIRNSLISASPTSSSSSSSLSSLSSSASTSPQTIDYHINHPNDIINTNQQPTSPTSSATHIGLNAFAALNAIKRFNMDLIMDKNKNLINEKFFDLNVNNIENKYKQITANQSSIGGYGNFYDDFSSNNNNNNPNNGSTLLPPPLPPLPPQHHNNILSDHHHQYKHQQQQHQDVDMNNNAINCNNSSLNNSLCHVCNDKSTGSHFGGISCESCKAFFRRSVQNNRYLEYKCSYNNECKMNMSTRKICQSCRYKCCLAIGMKPKWVLSDSEREQKYGNRRRKLKQQQQQPQPQQQQAQSNGSYDSCVVKKEETSPQSSIHMNDIDMNGTDNSNSNTGTLTTQNSPNNIVNNTSNGFSSNSSATSPAYSSASPLQQQQQQQQQPGSILQRTLSDLNNDDLFYQYGIDLIDTNTLTINKYEQIFIDKITYAFYHARQSHELDLSQVGVMIQKLMANKTDVLQKSAKLLLANFMDKPIKRVITFVKLLPEYRKLNICDQTALLRGSTMEMFICSSQNLFDKQTNSFSSNIISKERNIKSEHESNIKLELLRIIWSEDVLESTLKYLKSMIALNINETALAIYLGIILYSPDRREFNDRKRILDIQTKYSVLLLKYLIFKFDNNYEMANDTHKKLMLKLIDLRNLHELHSSILLDVDPTLIFPQTILKDEKEEVTKLKPTTSSTTPTPIPTTTTNIDMKEQEEQKQFYQQQQLQVSQQPIQQHQHHQSQSSEYSPFSSPLSASSLYASPVSSNFSSGNFSN